VLSVMSNPRTVPFGRATALVSNDSTLSWSRSRLSFFIGFAPRERNQG